MKVICKETPINAEYEKVMHFTKGKTYEAVEFDDLEWMVIDDNGDPEYFFNIDIIFKR